jgi:integrase
MIYVHQTVDRYGHLEAGTKTTHHVAERDKRGRWTLFPRSLQALVDERTPHFDGRLFPSPRGKYWSHRNFYRNVWEPAADASGTEFTLYDARHTFSSRLLAAGVPLLEVSAWMGHSLRAGGEQLNTTARTYAHATGDSRTDALRELDTFVRLVNRLMQTSKRRAVRPNSHDERPIVQVATTNDDRSKVENVNGDQTVTRYAK